MSSTRSAEHTLQRVVDALEPRVRERVGDDAGDLAERAAAELDRLRIESSGPVLGEVRL